VNENFDDQLDSAIEALLRNGTRADPVHDTDTALIESVQFAADLRQKMPVARPSEAAFQRGRARLLATVDARRRIRTPYRILPNLRLRRVFKAFLAPAGLARRAAISSTLLVICLALSGALGASAGSLPGDPLYGLKRMQEQLRLSLTTNSDARERLQRQIDETRVTELNAVREMLRVVRTEVSGIVNAVDGDTLVVDRASFTVDRSLIAALGSVNVGDRVTLSVQTNSDGSVVVVDLRREQRTESSANGDGKGGAAIPTGAFEATSRPTSVTAATGTAEPSESSSPAPTSHPSTGPQASPTPEKLKQFTAIPSSTLTGTPTPDGLRRTPLPINRPDITNTPRPPETREPTEIHEPSGTPDAARTRRPTDSPGPSKTPRPTATPTPTVTGTPDKME
jgi:hypothetical protein